MKKTQFIDVIKDIKKNIVSVISIIVFVALSVGVFFGISWFVDTLKNSYDIYNDEGKVANIEYYFAYGVNDQDLEKLKQIDGVDEIEGTYIAYGNVQVDGQSLICEFKTSRGQLDKISLQEGSLPTKANEVAIESYAAQEKNIQVGDVITVDQRDTTSYYFINQLRNYTSLEEISSLEDQINENHYALKEDTFTVTGIVDSSVQTIYYDHPYYYNELARTDMTFFISEEALDMENVPGYNKVYIYNQELTDLDIFSDEYKEGVTALIDKLSPTVEEINEESYSSVKDNSTVLLSDYNSKLEEAKTQIEDGEKQLEDGKVQYATYLKKINDGQKQLEDGKKQLDEGKELLDEAETKLNSAYATLCNYQNQYDTAKAKLDDINTRLPVINNTNYKTAHKGNPSLINQIRDSAKNVLTNSETTNDNVESKLTELFNSSETSITSYKELVDAENISYLITKLTGLKKSDTITDESIGNYVRGAIVLTYNNNLEQIILDLNQLETLADDSYTPFNETELKNSYDKNVSFVKDTGVTENEYDKPSTSTIDSFVEEVVAIQKYVVDYKLSENLASAQTKLNEKKTELDSGWATYNSGKSQYDEKEALYISSLQQYNDGLIELENGKKQLKTAKTKIEEGEKQLEEAKEQYQTSLDNYSELEEQLDQIQEVSYITIYTENSTAISAVSTISNIATKSRNSLVGLFFIIALLISYNVITRMISGSIKEIGTKKALGFRRKEILLHYLFVIMIILIVGFVFSVIVSFGIQLVMSIAMKKMLQFTMNGFFFSIVQMFVLFLAYFVVFSLITFISCNAIINRSAISLLSNNEVSLKKKHFYENWKVWNKLSLISKTTINNCFDDQKRVLSTIVGITSCTILLISALTIGDNVRNSFTKQFSEYNHFDYIVKYIQEENTLTQIDEILNENNLEGLNIYTNGIYYESNGKLYLGNLFVYPTGEDSSKFFDLKSHLDNEYDGKGTWLPASTYEYLDTQIGDEATITTLSGEEINGIVTGFVESHAPAANIFMDSDTYEQITGEEFVSNALIFDSKNYSDSEIFEMFGSFDGYSSMSNYKETVYSVADIYILLTGAIVLVYFLVSFVLGVFVILNLLFTLVDEKQREVIILMINGYSYKQAKKYIYTDTIYLTILSIFIGVILGNIVGIQLVKQLEDVYIMFIHTYDPIANIVGIVVTAILVYVMARIALRRVDRFRLTELTK